MESDTNHPVIVTTSTSIPKRLFSSIFLLFLVLGLIWISWVILVEKGTRRLISSFADDLKESGIELRYPETGKVYFKSGTLNVEDFSALIRAQLHDQTKDYRDYSISVDQMVLRLDDFSARQFLLYFGGLSIVAEDASEPEDTEGGRRLSRLEANEFFMNIQLDFLKPSAAKQQWKETANEIVHFFREGKTALPIEFSGKSLFFLEEELVKIPIFAEKREDTYWLVMDQETIGTVRDKLKERLTDAEVLLLAQNPLRVPGLLKIRNRAITESRRAYQNNFSVPERAYRHVLWSYWLARAYGVDFAESVTDAYEHGVRRDRKERSMNQLNNAIGRAYVEEEIPESEVLDLMIQDSSVVISPETL